MGTRKVIGPEIVSERMAKIAEGNVWFFITKINKMLEVNPIRLDGSIEITADFVMSDELYYRLHKMYLDAGWSNIERTNTEPTGGYPGKTIVRFYLQS